MKPIWGIDLGGTKIEGVIIDAHAEELSIIERMRIPTEKDKGYNHIISQIKLLVDEMAAKTNLRPEKIGLGTPGSSEPSSGLLKNSNTTALNGMPFHRDVQAKLEIPVSIANDANCFAIAEAKFGSVKHAVPDANVVFGIIMGTGVGGGLVVGGKIIGGLQGIGGEWGHNFLDDSGGKCYCGKIGCVETILSGPALERYYAKISGVKHALKTIISLYKAGQDEYAKQTVDRLLYFFGKGVSSIINLVDPDAIILGGGLGNIDLLYGKGVESVEKHVFNTRLETPFLKPELGDSAGVFGAALLVMD